MKLLTELKIKMPSRPVIRADDFAGYSGAPRFGILDFEIGSEDSPRIDINFNQRHQLALTIGAEFDANKVMLEAQTKVARRRLVRYLYGDVLTAIDEALSHIQGGDREEALKTLVDLRSAITAT